MTPTSPPDFAERLLAWWRRHGRHDLPWQQEVSPYRTWVSEIMLQQTQVATALPYFERFMAALPELSDLAAADPDQVLALWSGLGYYARARNLHKAAQHCMAVHGGALPHHVDDLLALPGIGRSTAHAILAQAFDQVAPILDGNVKRVMARHAGIAGWSGQRQVEQQLWQAAEARTPDHSPAAYTQAIMDLGALLCTRRQPDCAHCPVAADCQARRQGLTAVLPTPRPTRARPIKAITLLMLEDRQGKLWLTQRPERGIWGGLWCLPEDDAVSLKPTHWQAHSPRHIDHALTHFQLHITVQRFSAKRAHSRLECPGRWLSVEEALSLGLPKPVRQVIETLHRRQPT
jgi:A/G-specific adenine glycosylase